MIPRAVAFVVVAMPAQMEQIEFVDQSLAFQQVERAIHRYARDVLVDRLRVTKDFLGVHVARRRFHHLQHHAALARQPDAALAQLALETPVRFLLVDALARRDSMWSG